MGEQKFIWVKLTKEWGGYQIGDVIRFGENKGKARIDDGVGYEVPKQREVNVPTKRLKVEVATKEPAAETAEVTPKAKAKIDKPKKTKKS